MLYFFCSTKIPAAANTTPMNPQKNTDSIKHPTSKPKPNAAIMQPMI